MPSDRPNILLITGDEWRADSLGCAGNEVVRTPNVDALAARGTMFNTAWAPAPMCVPSRVSILTGQTPRVHGCMTNGITPTDNTTFPELLREVGYATSAFGKMHFVPVYQDLGFDTMHLAEQHGAGWQIDDYHRWLLDEHEMVDWIDLWDQVTEFRQTAPEWHHDTYGALASPIPEEAYHTNWITDRFIDDLKITSGDDPFFSWVSYIKPHHPFDPPGRYAEMYDPKDIPLPEPDDLSTKPHVASWRPDVGHFDISRWQPEDIQRMTALYYGNITLIDDCVGRIVRALEEKGIADNTVIIVTSDHGDFLGNRGFITKTPFVLYDDIVRVPFVVADGREQRQGQTSDAFVNLLDLFPTIMSLAGIGHDHRIHGHDLCPLLSGEVSQVTDMAVSESPWRQLAIRKGAWKLIQGPSNAACELYNLEIDPGERNNRFEEMAGSTVVADLRESALRYLLGTTWDRHICDVVGVQKVVDDEMKRLKREPLTIDPHSWRDSWPEELG